MKRAVRAGFAALVLGGTATGAAASGGRFFASARQCESAGALAPGACRTAFANALAEFAAKAPTFRSRRACFKAFGPCMPWPPGTRRFDAFRPQLIGVTIEAEQASPAVAPGHVRLDLAPQSTASLSPAAAVPLPRPADQDSPSDATIMTPDADEADHAPPAARAGGGFTVIDGVLTYPAPARFQARKTPRQP